MCALNVNKATDIIKNPENQLQSVTDVHIAVFFDGTGNNMVQQMYFEEVCKAFVRIKEDNRISSLSPTVKEEHGKIMDLLKKKEDAQEKFEKASMKLMQSGNNYYAEEMVKSSKEIDDIDKQLQYLNAHTNIDTESLAKATEKVSSPKDENDDNQNDAYSNIAILYSLFNQNFATKSGNTSDNSVVYHIYIEGSGENDITNPLKSNLNGLGFGLGLTGVTALVSKAVRYVTQYVNSIKSKTSEDTQFHFYVFGFSRGSACSRLFSYLLTREEKEKLEKREHEFMDFLGNNDNKEKYFDKKGKLKFLEEYRNRITVEFLGIYDTVVSIGFLKQKDGWTDPLREPYDDKPNYIDNWHFLNVQEYGMKISKNVKQVCHICALDEFRENFALTNIGSKVPDNAIEILIPGCHSDVGGGYSNRKEEPAVILHKQCEKKGVKIPTKVNLTFPHENVASKSYLSAPDSIVPRDCMPMVLDAFERLGWIDRKTIGKVNNEKYEACTLSAIENNNLLFKHIKFKRRVLRGYSDIPLAMMRQRCLKVNKYFFNEIINEFQFNNDSHGKLLKKIGEELMKLVSEANGQRIWYYPGKSYISDDYKKLRFHYLHFTSIGRIGHFNNPFGKGRDLLEFEGANFGNKPNFDLNGLLCRITYHGDDDNIDVNGYEQAVHYLYELGQCGPSIIM